MSLCRQLFPAVLIVSLLLVRGAWAQSYPGPLNSSNPETKSESNFLKPWQPCLTPEQEGVERPLPENGGQSSQAVIGPPINKPVSIKNPMKAPGTKEVSPPSGSLKSSLAKYRPPVTPNTGLPIGSPAPGSLPSVQGLQQSSDYGSSFLNGYLTRSLQNQGMGLEAGGQQSSNYGSSFLDGYLLKSLQGQGIGRNKAPEGSQAKDDRRHKGKGAF